MFVLLIPKTIAQNSLNIFCYCSIVSSALSFLGSQQHIVSKIVFRTLDHFFQLSATEMSE